MESFQPAENLFDYMDNFWQGWFQCMHARRMRVTTLARAGTITWEIFRVSARLARTRLKFQPGLKLLSYSLTQYFNRISSWGRPEISAWSTGLKTLHLISPLVTNSTEFIYMYFVMYIPFVLNKIARIHCFKICHTFVEPILHYPCWIRLKIIMRVSCLVA